MFMREKSGGPRRDRRDGRPDWSDEGSQQTSPAADKLERSRAPGWDEFAASVQVTETERAWIREHLLAFHENEYVTDVIGRIKAGKEATVYLCAAHPNTGRSLIAAKLYRERSLRSSKNVGLYQQGRGMLDEDGNASKHSSRVDKSVSQKSKRGEAAHTSWLMHEFTLLEAMHAEGADVPEPIEHGGQALLMEFIGDETGAAPTLNDVELDPAEATQLFERVIFNVELLLGLGWAHGDLSPYNILYRAGRIVLIDFPQVVDCLNNPKARGLFERDIERVVQYFVRFGIDLDHRELAAELWSKHVADSETDG
jgi:RIO kinase 1